MSLQNGISGDTVQNVHIGGHDLPATAAGKLFQNAVNNAFLPKNVKVDTAEQHTILLRSNGFGVRAGCLHTKQPTGVTTWDNRQTGRAIVAYAIDNSSFRPVVEARSGRKSDGVRISVITPAFNEEATIGTMVQSLAGTPDTEIIVAANGCIDRTAEVARAGGARVVEIATPSKAAALNAADALATGDVRIYLDADVPADPELIRGLAAAVDRPGVEAAVPRPVADASGSTWPVRAYYAINARLPVFRGRLFGRGVVAMSARARARFGRFPELTADDLFLDVVVPAGAKAEIDLPVRVVAPRTTGELIRRVARARDGNAEFRRFVAASPELARNALEARNTSWLRDVVLPAPWLLPAAVVYVGVVLLADRRRRSSTWDARSGWGRPAIPAQRRPTDVADRPAHRR